MTDVIWFAVRADEVCLLRDGAQAFPVMLDAIRHAEREVLLEMYWVNPDRAGLRFLDALVEKAKQGVTVRVIYDAFGSLAITPAFWGRLVDAGGQVVPFHALFPLRSALTLDMLERRDHRKLLVVDGRIGFTGGINLSRQWLPEAEGGQGWRDDMIGVRGDAAQELRTLFYDTWRKASDGTPGSKPRDLPPDVRPIHRRRTSRVWVLASPWRKRRDIRREYLWRIQHAQRSVDIANSYFVPNRSVRGALWRAAERGVRVRVLVPDRSDLPIVQFAVEALFDKLLKHGVEIYALPGRVLHAKTAIVDDFATIGSYNLDERSWRKNLEVNLAVDDEAFAAHVRDSFERDCREGQRVDLATWRLRPRTRRAFEWLAYGLRRLW